MKRGCFLLLTLTSVAAAAPPPHGSLPLPPIPPAHQPTDAPAPTPDRDAVAPATPPSDRPRLTPRFVQVPTWQRNFDPSQGYTSGSRLQEDPSDRRLMPSPGIELQVPFR